MADESEHVAKLVAARSRMVIERREVASALTEKYKRSHTDNMRELLVQIQSTIEAIDRAIADEEKHGERARSANRRRLHRPSKTMKDTRASPRVGASP